MTLLEYLGRSNLAGLTVGLGGGLACALVLGNWALPTGLSRAGLAVCLGATAGAWALAWTAWRAGGDRLELIRGSLRAPLLALAAGILTHEWPVYSFLCFLLGEFSLLRAWLREPLPGLGPWLLRLYLAGLEGFGLGFGYAWFTGHGEIAAALSAGLWGTVVALCLATFHAGRGCAGCLPLLLGMVLISGSSLAETLGAGLFLAHLGFLLAWWWGGHAAERID